MVVVVNGEILPDSDPRAVRARQKRGLSSPSSSAASSAGSRAAPDGGLSRRSISSFLSRAARTGQASLFGRENRRTVTVPPLSFIGKPAVEVPVYILVVAAVLIALLGVQGAVFVALVYLFYTPWTHDTNRAPSPSSWPREAAGSGARTLSSPSRGGSTGERSRRVLGEEEREARMQRLSQPQKEASADDRDKDTH
ncbi:conserved hypothetical protein [Neospora caninum Liverpool]|uniref:Transmembrane protein n=1 Tax=Neospora caninum (strain Liverpool) TaxID=572307 RepID=F0VGQ6_NEOCL|nr:conserved hypothetical protein [Neospora caninum Liverpool]CBZ52900.1 conserved hypothetical protein [Neospora caninum Liverpool]CEL66882.1 TPA: hypothetical protein BN1204_026880 [Neospora caninum Liverpool]|eukprot:XP_003882932.1 conserved hypothetical protein [Neospora caninum Liverpool]